jgi:hypothetical protein
VHLSFDGLSANLPVRERNDGRRTDRTDKSKKRRRKEGRKKKKKKRKRKEKKNKENKKRCVSIVSFVRLNQQPTAYVPYMITLSYHRSPASYSCVPELEDKLVEILYAVTLFTVPVALFLLGGLLRHSTAQPTIRSPHTHAPAGCHASQLRISSTIHVREDKRKTGVFMISGE